MTSEYGLNSHIKGEGGLGAHTASSPGTGAVHGGTDMWPKQHMGVWHQSLVDKTGAFAWPCPLLCMLCMLCSVAGINSQQPRSLGHLLLNLPLVNCCDHPTEVESTIATQNLAPSVKTEDAIQTHAERVWKVLLFTD